MSKEIHLDAPNIGRLEKRHLGWAVDSGYVSTVGPFVSEFETKFAEYLNAKKAVATQSGTAALHISLHELGIGEGDEVIVPALTFVATVNPVLYVGAKPVFADVDVETWNIDPVELEKKITRKTKAVIPVHLYGNPCNMAEINRIAKRYKLFVVEDATESLGARYGGRYTGTLGDLGCYSFNGNKDITTGGGGMIVGEPSARLNHIRFLINQAREESNGYRHPEIGFNYRMTNIEAALGLAQLKRLEGFLKKKRMYHRVYQEELRGLNIIRFQKEYKDAESSHWLTVIYIERDTEIDELQKKLSGKGIPTRRIFMPPVNLPPYRKYKKDPYKSALNLYRRCICLPSSTLNSGEEVHRVCKVVKGLLK